MFHHDIPMSVCDCVCAHVHARVPCSSPSHYLPPPHSHPLLTPFFLSAFMLLIVLNLSSAYGRKPVAVFLTLASFSSHGGPFSSIHFPSKEQGVVLKISLVCLFAFSWSISPEICCYYEPFKNKQASKQPLSVLHLLYGLCLVFACVFVLSNLGVYCFVIFATSKCYSLVH